MHTHGAGRRRGKSRARILYWFRTPPGVRIGRSALDEDAIRAIEEHNPDVEFDWTRILKGQDVPSESRAAAPQAHRDRRNQRRREFQQSPHAATAAATAAPGREAEAQPPTASGDDGTTEPPHIVSAPAVESAPEAVIEQFFAESSRESTADRVVPGDAVVAAEARLGSEGLSRLRARYSEVLARISETVEDPVRRDELKSQAERLNPDTWVTDSEVTAGLESYETVFESLRTVVGRKRRRRRRSQRPGSSTASTSDATPPEPSGGKESESHDSGEDL